MWCTEGGGGKGGGGGEQQTTAVDHNPHLFDTRGFKVKSISSRTLVFAV